MDSDITFKLKTGEYTLKSRSGKSVVWKKFGMVVDEEGKELPFAACIKCLQPLTYSRNSGTSHLNR